MGMPATTRWTVEMVRALPDDGKRYEVIDGELGVQREWRRGGAFISGGTTRGFLATSS